jgi:hypothetical protein
MTVKDDAPSMTHEIVAWDPGSITPRRYYVDRVVSTSDLWLLTQMQDKRQSQS